MKKEFLIGVFLFSGTLLARGQYYIRHINIVDVEKGAILRDQSVCIEGSRIKSISADARDGDKVPTYDGAGLYLMPGLWDMHIHDGGDDSSNRWEYVPLFLANGVTGIRDMWGDPDMLQLKRDIDAGRFIGPRMIVGSPLIDGEKSIHRRALRATTEQQGRRLVDSLADAGYDFIKVYSLVREPVYLAMADECKKKGIYLEGHLPIEIGVDQALDAGQRSFEHNFGINRWLTGKEAESIQWAHHYLDTVHSTADVQFMVRIEPLGVSEKDFHLSTAALDKMISRRVAVVPTLTLAQGRSIKSDSMARRTKGLQYLTSGFVQYWMEQTPAFPAQFVKSFGAAARFLVNKGVLILAGTDVNNPFCVPGFGLQQELVNLYDAGLTNLQVLQTATINPAKFLYLEKELGTVEAGKLADLLILEDDPLRDIRNTQKIHAVIVNGKYFSKEEIGRMLAAQKKR